MNPVYVIPPPIYRVILTGANTFRLILTQTILQGPPGAAGADGADGGGDMVLDVKDFGSVGDGVTDDTDGLEDAIAEAKSGEIKTVYLPEGIFLIRRTLILPSNVELRGAGIGRTIIIKAATVKSFITVDAVSGGFSVTVTSSTGFNVGDAIHMADAATWEWVSTQAVITGIAGNVITFDKELDADLTALDGAFATTSFPMTMNEVGAVNIRVTDLTINQNRNSNDPNDEFTIATIHWVEAYYAVVENCELLNAAGDAYSDQAQDGTSITPAANLIKTTKNTIRNCKIRNAQRHGVHLGTMMNGAFVLNNEITNCGDDGTVGYGYGVFYCAYVTYTVVSNNIIQGCGQGLAGIDERDYGNIIANNQIKLSRTWAISASGTGAGGKNTVTANSIACTTYGKGILWTESDCTFSENIIDLGTSGGEGIRLSTTADRNLITGNIFKGGGSGGRMLFLDGCDDTRVIGNSFNNGTYPTTIRGVNRMVAIGNHFSTMSTNTAWRFEVSASTDCLIKDDRNMLTTPVTEDVATVRLVYEGLGNNGANNPASAGDWNITTATVANRKYDGVHVYWNDGTAHISIFKQAIGWSEIPAGSAASFLARANHTGTQEATTIIEDATHRFATDAEKTTWDAKQNALGFTAEDVANKDIDGTLAANSDTKYPSQKAVKTYVDANGGGTVDATVIDGSNNAVAGNAVFDQLALKQDTLVSATNIKTINSTSLLGSGDIAISGTSAWGGITGTLTDQTDLNTALGLKSTLASPTFTGTVVLPSTTSIGTTSSTELGYVDGVTSAIQTQLDSKRDKFKRVGTATGVFLVNSLLTPSWNAFSTTGTVTARTAASTNRLTSTRRVGYVSAGTAGAAAGARVANITNVWRGNAAGLGGFDMWWTFGISQTQTGYLFYCGLIAAGTPIGVTTLPSALVDILGVGFDQGTDTNLQLLHNDASGVATKVDTGIAPSTTTFYRLRVYCAPNGSDVTIVLKDIGSGTEFSTTVSSNIPASNTFLGQQLHISNNATAAVVSVEFGEFSMETD